MNSKVLITVLAFLSLCLWGGLRIKAGINFTQNCGGYFERAANANTIELATREMSYGVEWMEYKDFKKGYTSVLWRTPDEDIGYWYTNMTASLAELKTTKSDATPLERSNVLMKLRESLIKHGDNGESLTVPEGISVYPNNTAFFLWGWLSFIVLCIAGGAVIAENC
jgi:hypothetical protein